MSFYRIGGLFRWGRYFSGYRWVTRLRPSPLPQSTRSTPNRFKCGQKGARVATTHGSSARTRQAAADPTRSAWAGIGSSAPAIAATRTAAAPCAAVALRAAEGISTGATRTRRPAVAATAIAEVPRAAAPGSTATPCPIATSRATPPSRSPVTPLVASAAPATAARTVASRGAASPRRPRPSVSPTCRRPEGAIRARTGLTGPPPVAAEKALATRALTAKVGPRTRCPRPATSATSAVAVTRVATGGARGGRFIGGRPGTPTLIMG